MDANQIRIDEDKGRKDIEAKEERVLFPETDRKEVSFLGRTISLRPLPIKWAKVVNRACDEARALLRPDAEDRSERDEQAASAYVRAAVAICEFYDVPTTPEDIEGRYELPEVMAFCDAQLAKNGSNDFLLWRLRDIGRVRDGALDLRTRVTPFPSLPSSPASPKNGEDLTESLTIPTDK